MVGCPVSGRVVGEGGGKLSQFVCYYFFVVEIIDTLAEMRNSPSNLIVGETVEASCILLSPH